MMNRRKVLISGAAVASTILLSGCLTRALFEDTKYTEKVSSVMISADGKKLVFVGKNYHYIFDVPDIVLKTIQSPFHKFVKAMFSSFRVRNNGDISGDLNLSLDSKAPADDQQNALTAGYKQFEGGAISAGVTLSGTRYDANGTSMSAVETPLNKSYDVDVFAEQSSAQKTGHALLTPITVAADGVYLIAAVPLVAITFGLITMCADGSGGSSCR